MAVSPGRPRPTSWSPRPTRTALSDRIANRALLFVALTGARGRRPTRSASAVVGPLVPVRGADAVLVGGALAAVLLLARDRPSAGSTGCSTASGAIRSGRSCGSAGRSSRPRIRPGWSTRSPRRWPRRCGSPTSRSSSPTGRPVPGRDADPARHRGPARAPGPTLGTLRAGRRGEALGRADVQVLAGRRRSSPRRPRPAGCSAAWRRPGSGSSGPGRRSGAGCGATCTTSSGRRWPASASAWTPPAAGPGATPRAPTS